MYWILQKVPYVYYLTYSLWQAYQVGTIVICILQVKKWSFAWPQPDRTNGQKTYEVKYVSSSSTWTFRDLVPRKTEKSIVPDKVGIAYASREVSILGTDGWATEVKLLLTCFCLLCFLFQRILIPVSACIYDQLMSAKEKNIFLHHIPPFYSNYPLH